MSNVDKMAKCLCGAVLQIDELEEINASFVNLYYCPGGTTIDGRKRAAHIEPKGSVKQFTSPFPQKMNSAIKAEDEKIEPFGKCLEADPVLYNDIGVIHGEQFQVVFFLESFCIEHFSKFCHQTPVHGYDDWILTGVDEFDGVRLPFIRKQIPPALEINGVQFFRFEIEDLLDLSNTIKWSLEVFSNG